MVVLGFFRALVPLWALALTLTLTLNLTLTLTLTRAPALLAAGGILPPFCCSLVSARRSGSRLYRAPVGWGGGALAFIRVVSLPPPCRHSAGVSPSLAVLALLFLFFFFPFSF